MYSFALPRESWRTLSPWRRPRIARPPTRQCRAFRSSRSTRRRTGGSSTSATSATPRGVSVHPRRVRVDVPRAVVDDAPVRGLRHRRGDERALPLSARARPDGAFRRVRHADADGLRLRPPAPLGEVGREGVAVDSLDDMRVLFQGIPLGDVSTSMTINSRPRSCSRSTSAWPRSRAFLARHFAARPRRTSSRSTSRRRSGSSHPSRRCGSSPTWSSSAPARCRSSTRSRSRATTSARRDRRPRRSSPSRSRTGSSTSSGRCGGASRSTSSLRGCRSSSTPTSISSRRSRSTVRHDASGRESCASGTAPPTSARCGCASTPRPPGCR